MCQFDAINTEIIEIIEAFTRSFVILVTSEADHIETGEEEFQNIRQETQTSEGETIVSILLQKISLANERDINLLHF